MLIMVVVMVDCSQRTVTWIPCTSTLMDGVEGRCYAFAPTHKRQFSHSFGTQGWNVIPLPKHIQSAMILFSPRLASGRKSPITALGPTRAGQGANEHVNIKDPEAQNPKCSICLKTEERFLDNFGALCNRGSSLSAPTYAFCSSVDPGTREDSSREQ